MSDCDIHREVICIVGPPESGKSYLARKFYGRANRALVISYDEKDQYPGVTCQTFDALTERCSSSFFRAVYYPERDHTVHPDVDPFTAALQLVELLQTESKKRHGRPEPFLIAIEEITIYLDFKEPFGVFGRLARQGRHIGVDLVVTTQAPTEFPLFLRNAMTQYFFFQTVEINALEFVRKTLGPEAEAMVRNLPQYVPLHYDRTTREITPRP